MRLSNFIQENEDEILQEWEDFARRLRSAPDEMSADELRDHARGMLRFLAEQLVSSAGTATRKHADESAPEAHGGDRVDWGFSLRDMVAEFRALRATVTRLWARQADHLNSDDLIRFNDAMDRALGQSLKTFIAEKEHREHLLESMLSYSPDHSYIFDRSGRILYANRSLADVYGKHPKDIVGKRVDEVDPAFAEEVHRQIAQVIDTGREYRGDFSSSTRRGDVHVVEYLFAPVFDEQGRVEAIAGTSRDITARKAWERTLWQHANHDHLTGVPNRRLFLDRLEQDMRFANRNQELLALLYIDLDKFKDANDRLGHDGGDQLLRQCAERIQSCIRETDTIARMGGDEFTVILVAAGDETHVEAVARAILARLSRPFSIEQKSVQIAASIGIALYPEHGVDVNELTANADRAMYSAKNAGGDSFHFFGSTNDVPQRPRLHVADSHHGRRH